LHAGEDIGEVLEGIDPACLACRHERVQAREALPVVSQFSIATDSRSVSLVEGEHATEPFASADAAAGRGRIGRGEGDDIAQAPVVALGVVVVHELAHDGTQMASPRGTMCRRHSCLIDRTNLSA
jgi:hypothetical protein